MSRATLASEVWNVTGIPAFHQSRKTTMMLSEAKLIATMRAQFAPAKTRPASTP